MGEIDDEIADLLRATEAYCAAHSIAESTLGRLAVNDGKLFARLRGGSSITMRTEKKLRAFMANPPDKQPEPAAEAVQP
jgi:hypothetical protein